MNLNLYTTSNQYYKYDVHARTVTSTPLKYSINLIPIGYIMLKSNCQFVQFLEKRQR